MGSSRFPGKPLAPLLGRPMIEHVVRRVAMCDRVDETFVATCDAEIRDAVEGFGGTVIMTSPEHERASDRVAEAAEQVEGEIVVMVQGDEPMVTPDMIVSAIAPLQRDPEIGCVNLARRITRPEEHRDPNTIKVAMDIYGNALYFSRSPIPAVVDPGRPDQPAVFKQVCVIPFRRDFLRQFARLRPTPLERAESVDMLRAIEHGLRVHMVETDVDTYAVDTLDDLRYVSDRMRNDPLVGRYVERPVRLEARA